ncbi:MAG: carbohydrate kinase family protein [Fimbriimonas sp.]
MYDAIVAGHICLDIIPSLSGSVALEPGRLVEAGPAVLSTGGAVSNTGQALAKLGVKTRLMGKVGDDLFGRAVLELLGENGTGMVVTPGEPTSYTVVINLSGRDRTFIHAPGCNNTFTANDVPVQSFDGVKLFHFGYPPLMAKMFEDDGEELLRLFRKAKDAEVTTSLDMTLPDPNSPAGKANWRRILERVLPFVDIFAPSCDELSYMLGAQDPGDLADQCLEMGAGIAAVKCGDRGLLLRAGCLDYIGPAPWDLVPWYRADLWAPAFKVDVAGTTGAGDATIAGLLCGMLNGQGPLTSARMAVAAGAFCCEAPDATSGLPTGATLLDRLMDPHWERLAGPGEGWLKLASGEYARRF